VKYKNKKVNERGKKVKLRKSYKTGKILRREGEERSG